MQRPPEGADRTGHLLFNPPAPRCICHFWGIEICVCVCVFVDGTLLGRFFLFERRGTPPILRVPVPILQQTHCGAAQFPLAKTSPSFLLRSSEIAGTSFSLGPSLLIAPGCTSMRGQCNDGYPLAPCSWPLGRSANLARCWHPGF